MFNYLIKVSQRRFIYGNTNGLWKISDFPVLLQVNILPKVPLPLLPHPPHGYNKFSGGLMSAKYFVCNKRFLKQAHPFFKQLTMHGYMHLNIIEYENSVLVKHAILHEFIFIFVY